jgi:iron complex transport system ATP-binding protein
MSLLEARNLAFSYGPREVLRDVSLSMSSGEVIALLGPNGSGKSTLLRLLMGQLRGSGQVQWNGRDLRSWSRRDFARKVAYLPQSPAADPEQSVADVLRMGRTPYWGPFGIESEYDAQTVERIASEIGLTEFLSRPIGELSGGQRQLVFLGRCLVQEPVALLLDEPNTFLDLRHQFELAQLVRRLSRESGLAILMTCHDLALASAMVDRIILLSEGKVAIDGPPAQALDPILFSRVYGVPIERIDIPGVSTPVLLPRIS